MENQETNVNPPAGPELTITDLQNTKALIETAVRRGVFAAEELSSVGAVYDKLSAFLTAVSKQQKPAE